MPAAPAGQKGGKKKLVDLTVGRDGGDDIKVKINVSGGGGPAQAQQGNTGKLAALKVC